MAYGWPRRTCILTVAAAVLWASAPAAHAGDSWIGDTADDGVTVNGMGRSALMGLAGQTHDAVNAASTGPWFRFASASYCTDLPPGATGSSDPSCTIEFTVCNPTGRTGPVSGPAVRVWRMEVDQAGRPVAGAAWENIGWTCLSALVPGANTVLTMQMIIDQFHKTVFAKPTAAIQPVGLKTLVNLPTYYELTWPNTGYEPGEVDTSTLVGRRVEIEPLFRSATYLYGDGQTSGPVKSVGGPHPTGDVVHTYRTKMVAPVQINVTYGGRFRVDGGAWVTIPDTVTIEGTPTNLTVAEAKARLYK